MADQGGKAQITLSAVDTTKAAFDSVKRNFETVKSSADGLLLKFGSLGLAITGAFEGISIKGVIDAADELSKLSQKTGIAIDDLSALKYAGDLANVGIDDLATGIKKLGNNMAAAAGGSKQAVAIFDALGVNIKTAGGALRSTDDVLGDIADKFASYKDGAGKAALATETFGKNGAALIPFLNSGRAGLQDMKEEAQKLGIVIGGDFGKQSEAFNDNLTRLNAAAKGAKIALANELLPTLNATLDAFVANTKAAGLFKGALLTIGEGISQRLGLDELGQLQSKAKDTSTQIAQVTTDMERLALALKINPSDAKATAGMDKLRTRMLALQTEANATGDAIKKLADQNTKAATPADKPAGTKDAPIVKKQDGADEALHALKANLAAKLQATQQNLEAEQQLLTFDQSFAQRVYDTGNTSLTAFYESQDEIRKRGLEEQRKALNQSITDQLDYQAKLPKDKTAELLESQAKVAAFRAKLDQTNREAQQAATLSAVDRPDALANQKRQLDIFQGQFADMVDGTRTRAAEFADIAVKVAAARKQLIQGGTSDVDADKQTADLATALKTQHDFNVARDEFARVTDRAKDSEDALALVQQSNGTGLLESEKQLTALRQQELEQLGKVLEATRSIAAVNPNNDALIAGLRQAELAYAHLAATADATKTRLDAAADSLGSGIADSVGRAITDGTKLKDLLGDIGKQIEKSVTNELIVKPISADISNFIKGSGGAGIGENLLGFITGQNSNGSKANASAKLPSTITGGAGGTAQTVTDSLNNLKAGADPLTVAFGNLQRAVDSATTSMGGRPAHTDASQASDGTMVAGLPADGPAGGELALPATTGSTRPSGSGGKVGTETGDSLSTLMDSSLAATTALTLFAASAGKGSAAIALLPTLIQALLPAITGIKSNGESTASGGLFGLFGKLFSGSGAANDSAVSSGAALQANGFAGYDLGGFTGYKGTKEVAGVVHGREFVFSAPAVATLGANYLQNMHVAARAGVRGYESGGYVGRMPGAQAWPAANSAPAQRPIIVNINQQFAAGATQQTTSQAALQAGREFARASRRGSA